MSATDTNGVPWATVSQVKAGTVLRADGGFDCLEKDKTYVVQADDKGELFVPCHDGAERHYLDGQLDDDEVYVGLYLA